MDLIQRLLERNVAILNLHKKTCATLEEMRKTGLLGYLSRLPVELVHVVLVLFERHLPWPSPTHTTIKAEKVL